MRWDGFSNVRRLLARRVFTPQLPAALSLGAGERARAGETSSSWNELMGGAVRRPSQRDGTGWGLAMHCRNPTFRVAVVALATIAGPAAGQRRPGDAEPPSVWLGTGLGGSTVGMSVTASLGIQVSKWVVSVRAMGHAHIGLFTSGDEMFEGGLLLGRTLRQPSRHDRRMVAVAAGIGPVWRSQALEPELAASRRSPWRHTLGIPIELELCDAPMPVLGFCFNTFANINTERVLGGLILVFRYGKLH